MGLWSGDSFVERVPAGAVQNRWMGCGWEGGQQGRRSHDWEGALVSDAIRQIREAEEEGDEAQRAARAEGKRLIAEAYEASEKLLEEMRRGVREEERVLTATATAEADAQASAIAAESRVSIEAVRGGAETRVRQGVARVLDAIVSGS